MPTLSWRPTLLRWLLPALAVVAVSVAAGWWLGQRQGIRPAPVDPRRAALTREAEGLRERVRTLRDTSADRQRLLELLVGLDRKPEAITLLEGWADRDPQRWSLRLMLAELRRDQDDRRGAERELRQILHLHPTRIEALQLMSLVLLEQGRGAEAEALVKAAHDAMIKASGGKAGSLEHGLLLAELRQRRGSPAAAEATYLTLMEAFPADQRPALALALLRQQRGQTTQALQALDQARERGGPDAANRATLDRLAASWRLKALRQSPKAGVSSPAAPTPPAAGGSGSPAP